VSANSRGEITPLYLSAFENEDGKIPPRLVDTESEIAKLCFQNMHYILEEDYPAARVYLKQPEQYDFNKILSWS